MSGASAGDERARQDFNIAANGIAMVLTVLESAGIVAERDMDGRVRFVDHSDDPSADLRRTAEHRNAVARLLSYADSDDPDVRAALNEGYDRWQRARDESARERGSETT